MDDDKRTDTNQAHAVEAALRILGLWGDLSAWRYLRARGVAPTVAARVLGHDRPRRHTDTRHPADAGPGTPAAAAGARPAQPADDSLRRTNPATACAVDRAIGMASTHGWHYAESLLRIYALDTPTVMRVLCEPRRRRRTPPGR